MNERFEKFSLSFFETFFWKILEILISCEGQNQIFSLFTFDFFYGVFNIPEPMIDIMTLNFHGLIRFTSIPIIYTTVIMISSIACKSNRQILDQLSIQGYYVSYMHMFYFQMQLLLPHFHKYKAKPLTSAIFITILYIPAFWCSGTIFIIVEPLDNLCFSNYLTRKSALKFNRTLFISLGFAYGTIVMIFGFLMWLFVSVTIYNLMHNSLLSTKMIKAHRDFAMALMIQV